MNSPFYTSQLSRLKWKKDSKSQTHLHNSALCWLGSYTNKKCRGKISFKDQSLLL